MNQDKMYLINKLFNDKTTRTVWDKDEEKYYISVVDVAGAAADSDNPRKYWNWLKNKLKNEEDFELSSITRQLKLKSSDGKYYMTDVVDIEGMFRIIESIPSKNAEPIKQWLAKLGSERIDEIFNPSIATQRSIDLYRAKGFDEVWITKRIKGIQDRKKITDVWKDGGITGNKEYAILTNEIYQEWARIGLLVLNKGVYNNQRIVSEKYINEMVIEREKNYGYLWWIYPKNQVMRIIRKEYNTGKYDLYCANGVGESLIVVIPEANIVICITSSLVYNPKIRSELINNYLLPYIETKETGKALKK